MVAHTNVRRIADNLGLSKNAVATHLGRLKVYGFVLHKEQRHTGSGRYAASWYILDPSACIERFTTTPAVDQASSEPCPTIGDMEPDSPSPTSLDTGPDTVDNPAVSHVTGHRDVGQNRDSVAAAREQQHAARDHDDTDLVERLARAGVDGPAAERLLAEHDVELVEAALEALPWDRVRNPAGWLVKAIRDGWALEARDRGDTQPARQAPDYTPPAVERDGRAHEAWAACAVTVLDGPLMAEAVAKVTTPVAGIGRRSVPAAIGQLGSWAAAVHTATPGGSLRMPWSTRSPTRCRCRSTSG